MHHSGGNGEVCGREGEERLSEVISLRIYLSRASDSVYATLGNTNFQTAPYSLPRLFAFVLAFALTRSCLVFVSIRRHLSTQPEDSYNSQTHVLALLTPFLECSPLRCLFVSTGTDLTVSRYGCENHFWWWKNPQPLPRKRHHRKCDLPDR